MSYTYAVLELSPAAYAEIKRKLTEAGYGAAVQDGPGGEVIDMTGVAVRDPSGLSRTLPEPASMEPARSMDLPPSMGGASALERRGSRNDPPRSRGIPNPAPPRSSHYTPPHETDVTAGPSGRGYRPPREIDVTEIEFRGGEPLVKRDRSDKGPIRVVPESEVVKGPPPPVPAPSVRVAVRNDDGAVLAVDRGDGEGFNLPGGPLKEGEDAREAAIRILDEQAGLEAEHVVEAWSGPGDKWLPCTFFTVMADNGVEVQAEEGCRAEFIKIPELLCGTWGLPARDAFNAVGWMSRPRMTWQKIYELSARALRNGSHRDDKGVEEVVDEITFLADVGKLWAVDLLLADVNVRRLHGDVADTLLAMIEPLEGLRHKPRVEREIEELIEDLDGLRTPIRFNGHEDVRAAAKKIYRQKAVEFGKMLRNGTLAEKFGGRHRGGEPIRKDLPPGWETPPNGSSGRT